MEFLYGVNDIAVALTLLFVGLSEEVVMLHPSMYGDDKKDLPMTMNDV